MKIIRKISNFIKSLFKGLWSAFDIRDLLTYGGLLSIGYGFYRLFPWLGFVVLGVVSMLLGLGWLIRIPRNG